MRRGGETNTVMMSKCEFIPVWEFHDGRKVREWETVDAIAKFYHTHSSSIKALIYTGNPLPTIAYPAITFDLDPDSPWDLVEVGDSEDIRAKYIFVRRS